MINILIVIFNVCSSQKTVFILPAKKNTTGRCRQSWGGFSIICLLLFIIIPYTPMPSSCHLPDCSSTTRQSLLDTKASPLAASSLDSPGRRVSRQTLSSVKGIKTHACTHTTSIRKSPNQKKKKRTKERGEAPAFPILPPNPCPPSLPPTCPSPLSPKIRSKGQKKRGEKEEEEEKEKRSGAEEPKLQGEKARRRGEGGRGARRRCARSGGPKNQKVTQNQKLLLLLLVMYEWLNRN